MRACVIVLPEPVVKDDLCPLDLRIVWKNAQNARMAARHLLGEWPTGTPASRPFS